MSGLSAREKEGCRRLLELLDSPDLFSVVETVTNRLIQVFSREEAIDAILTYSKNSAELLKRRKVHRNAIFKYLADERVPVPPSCEKHQLIQCAIDHWAGPGVQRTQSPGKQVSEGGASELHPLDYKLLGEKFCEWFYQLLNSQNPLLGQKGDWGPQHFWDDAVLRFVYKAVEAAKEEHHGAQMASLRLLALTRDERLIFNPNLDSRGLKCVSSPHGLVVVAVAGTVHRDNVCLGLFEQIFGLIRCPIGKNWKIKHVDLKVLGQNALGTEQTNCLPSVNYQDSELQVYYADSLLPSRVA
ncbi:uncharacterized protein C3orf38 homolog [Hyperolius riggenbachi]|uniref:uncharacterized protein C3orf38 homolog n=1 Tax=Hyperolius riggenbachi TaxID=752182 RepID=UPI0035A361C2